MGNKLKGLKINEVSLVSAGANPGARQVILKTGDPEVVAKAAFNDVLAAMSLEEAIEGILEDCWDLNYAFRRSVRSVLDDANIVDKKTAIMTNVQQFMAALSTMVSAADLSASIQKSAGKVEDGKTFTAADFAYVPDPAQPSTWKLRLTSEPGANPDPGIVAAAVAALGEGFRGNKVEIPDSDRPAVLDKVKQAWLNANSDKTEADLPEVLKASCSPNEEELKKTVAQLAAQVAELQFLSSLSDVEKAHYASLAPEDQKVFKEATAEGRVELINKAALAKEEVEVNGVMIKKSLVGEEVFALVKAQSEQIKKHQDQVKKAEEFQRTEVLKSQAVTEYKNLPGSVDDKVLVLKSIDTLPQEERDRITTLLKSANASFGKLFVPNGDDTPPAEDGDGALTQLNTLAKNHATAQNITFEKAYSEVLSTDEGKRLYQQSLAK